jgi:hypothetical protein
MDASVLNPSYKAGLLRNAALNDLSIIQEESGVPSIALGRLGPPELSKLLFEAHLFKHAFGSMSAVLQCSDQELSEHLAAVLGPAGVADSAPSIGIPVLMPDGKTLLRGPRINVPELVGHSTSVPLGNSKQVEAWAAKGWIDLRPGNMALWKKRLDKMVHSRGVLRDAGSAAASIRTYMSDTFEPGEVVAWIFNNEMGGHRIKG